MGIAKQTTEQATKQSVDFWDRKWIEDSGCLISSWARLAFDWLDIDLTQVKQVLDVGCGERSTSYALDSDVPKHMISLDISSSALRLAKGHNDGPSFEYAQSNATSLPFRKNSFDMVTAFETLTLLGDAYINAIHEMWRVTRGYLLFNVTYNGGMPIGQIGIIQRISLDERETVKLLATLSPRPREADVYALTFDSDWNLREYHHHQWIYSEDDEVARILVMARK